MTGYCADCGNTACICPMPPVTSEATGLLEDCCWDWIRDRCAEKRFGTCTCACHTIYPAPPDWKAKAEYALTELAGARE